MRVLKKSFAVATLLCSTACTPQVRTLEHSPTMAAEEARSFARAALIERDFPKAYRMFADKSQRSTSFDQFTEAIRNSHPRAFPLTLAVVEYEPVPTQSGMNIYLYGENGEEKFYYRFVMEGVRETGYKVSGLWRNNGPYPPAPLKRRLGEGL